MLSVKLKFYYKKITTHLKDSASALLFPSFCLSCKAFLPKDLTILCSTCAEQLCLLDPEKRCSGCFAPLAAPHGSRCLSCKRKASMRSICASCFEFQGAVQCLMSNLLEQRYNSYSLVNSLASYLLIQHSRLGWPDPDIITFVPECFLYKRLKGVPAGELLSVKLAEMMQVKVRALAEKHFLSINTVRFLKKSHAQIAEGKILLLIDTHLQEDTMQVCDLLQEISPNKVYLLTLCSDN